MRRYSTLEILPKKIDGEISHGFVSQSRKEGVRFNVCLCGALFLIFSAAKVNIVEAPDIIRAPFGTSYELQCVATGDPPPLISWLKDGRMVRPNINS